MRSFTRSISPPSCATSSTAPSTRSSTPPSGRWTAYAKLVAAVARSVDRFLEQNVSDDDARAWLDRTLPGIDGAEEAITALALDAARRRTAKDRQQLLATMVLMGVNRALDCE